MNTLLLANQIAFISKGSLLFGIGALWLAFSVAVLFVTFFAKRDAAKAKTVTNHPSSSEFQSTLEVTRLDVSEVTDEEVKQSGVHAWFDDADNPDDGDIDFTDSDTTTDTTAEKEKAGSNTASTSEDTEEQTANDETVEVDSEGSSGYEPDHESEEVSAKDETQEADGETENETSADENKQDADSNEESQEPDSGPRPLRPDGLDVLLSDFHAPADLFLEPGATTEPSQKRVYAGVTDREAGAVGSSVADELERLGFEIKPVDYSTAQATKDGRAINMSIIPPQDSAKEKYPELHDEAVVIEIWVAD